MSHFHLERRLAFLVHRSANIFDLGPVDIPDCLAP